MLPKNDQHIGCQRVEEEEFLLVKGHFIVKMMDVDGVIKRS